MKFYFYVVFLFILACTEQKNQDVISNVNDLKSKEGKRVSINGKLLPADAIKRIPFSIQLQDSSIIYLGTFNSSMEIDFLKLDTLINKKVEVNGIVYFDSVPAPYIVA